MPVNKERMLMTLRMARRLIEDVEAEVAAPELEEEAPKPARGMPPPPPMPARMVVKKGGR